MCGFCGKEQESEYRLRQHELLSHTPMNQLSPDEVFVCDLCARIFKTKQSMRNHFIRAHTPKTEKFPCSICGKVLPHQKALYAHERVHIKTEATCQYCSKTFSRKVLLSSHIAIVHLKKRLSQCQYCPHQAITGGALKKHIRCKHLNLRQHHCDWPACGKSFHENQHLVRHYRSVNDEDFLLLLCTLKVFISDLILKNVRSNAEILAAEKLSAIMQSAADMKSKTVLVETHKF